MANTLEPNELPDGFQSTGDPVDGNPFPESDLRHDAWADATRSAEEEYALLNSRLLKERPGPEHAVYADWEIRLYVGRFDIWAKRGVHVVWSDADARHYDQWLFNYAQTILETARESAPFFVHAESLLCELRLKLLERVEHWKAEGRRYVSEQKAHMEAVDAGWLKLEGERLGGHDLAHCMKAAYDHHAGLIVRGGRPLTERVLSKQIPGFVFEGALHFGWIPYPLKRRSDRKGVDGFPLLSRDPPGSTYELVPESELTEIYRGRKVTKGYERQFKLILLSQIEHWRIAAVGTAASGPIERDRIACGLPVLSDATNRILDLRKQALVESYRLTGDAVIHYASASEQSRRIALGKIPDISGRFLWTWLTGYKRAKHECGITPSVDFSSARFDDLAVAYLTLWSPSAGCETFAGQLEVLKARVLGEITVIWKRSETTERWYKAVCEPAVNANVSGKVREFVSRARNSELVFLASKIEKVSPTPGSEEKGSTPASIGKSRTDDETQEERSARRKAVVDPLMKNAGVTSDEDWASRAGANIDRNTPRDYRNGLTKRLRPASREALAKALAIKTAELPD